MACTAILLIWIAWSQVGRSTEWTNSDSALDHKQVIQNDSICERNVVGIQPYMISDDYRSKRHFFEKMNSYFGEAKQAG